MEIATILTSATIGAFDNKTADNIIQIIIDQEALRSQEIAEVAVEFTGL